MSSTKEELVEEIKSINAEQLSCMFIAGAKALEEQKDKINELNVFPVPDGDTGINMSLTCTSGANEIAKLFEGEEGSG